MSKNGAKTANISAHYGYKFLKTYATRAISDSERQGIKRMKKRVSNNGKFNESRIIRIHSSDENKVIRVVQNLLKTY